jgi:hypothetical protein
MLDRISYTPPQGDYLTRYGASILAGVIERYWKKRGYEGVRVEWYETKPGSDTWGVRSNLVGGLPAQ